MSEWIRKDFLLPEKTSFLPKASTCSNTGLISSPQPLGKLPGSTPQGWGWVIEAWRHPLRAHSLHTAGGCYWLSTSQKNLRWPLQMALTPFIMMVGLQEQKTLKSWAEKLWQHDLGDTLVAKKSYRAQVQKVTLSSQWGNCWNTLGRVLKLPQWFLPKSWDHRVYCMEEPHSAGILPLHTQPQFILHREAVPHQGEHQGLRSIRTWEKSLHVRLLAPPRSPCRSGWPRGQEGALGGVATAARRVHYAEVVVPQDFLSTLLACHYHHHHHCTIHDTAQHSCTS